MIILDEKYAIGVDERQYVFGKLKKRKGKDPNSEELTIENPSYVSSLDRACRKYIEALKRDAIKDGIFELPEAITTLRNIERDFEITIQKIEEMLK